ncbi:class I SAM-dependent methyltransferase [Salibacteraceae bacterium]|nr:class I SAM-dependent methyltransferase [Salibacteraceae bacterium]
MPSKTRIGRGFDFVAPIYDFCVNLAFGETFNELQSEAISKLSKSNRCLILGGGTGKILKACLEADLSKSYFYCELSDQMISKCKTRLSKSELDLLHFGNDWRESPLDFDLIILPFVLDCYKESDVELLLLDLNKALSSEGQILIFDFNEESIEGFQASWLQKTFIKILYIFFSSVSGLRTTALPRIFTIAKLTGLELINRWDRKSGWIQASLWKKGN